MSRSFVYLMPSFSPTPIPVSPSESVTKHPPPLLLKAMLVLLKAMLVLLKAMLVSLLLCLPHTLSYPYPLLLIELVHLLPCLLLPHVCSPVSSSTYQLTPLPCLPHTLSYPYPLLLIELVHLLPCLLLPHVCSPVSSSTYQLTPLPCLL